MIYLSLLPWYDRNIQRLCFQQTLKLPPKNDVTVITSNASVSNSNQP
jgi:hypothetical protein